MRLLGYLSLLAVVLLAMVQQVIYWPQLPERVASHFGPNGQPDGWMPKPVFVAFMVGIQLATPCFMLGVSRLTSVLPESLVNIPHREYWLHPDRKEKTLAYGRDLILWIAVFTGLLLIWVSHLTFLANRDEQPLNRTWSTVAIVCYLAVVFACCGHCILRFRVPRNAA